MRPFGHTSGVLRGVAALVSLALTASIFLLLRATSSPPPARRGEQQVVVTIFPSKRALQAAPPAPVATQAKIGVRSITVPRARSITPSSLPEQGPAVASAGLAASPPADALAASAPLRIDAKAIGRAIAGSEGSIRQMARRSGVELDSPRASRSEALADTVGGTGVADCLAPNAGGSLLSAPLLLLLAVQGKCK